MPTTTPEQTHDRRLASCAYPWSPVGTRGTFRNPIICADYSDPDVVRHGNDFYLTASSFNCTPGLPVLHSKDLVNWTILGHAIKNVPHARYAEVQHGCGVWAPSIRFHAGKFWIFFPTPDEGIYFVTAENPRGPWSEPTLLLAGKGLIDPCPLWDDDGNAYLVHAYARSRSGLCHMIRVRPMAPDASRILGEGQLVFHDPERHPTIEGPKFLKKDGWYYILAPAGGVANGWQVALRSKNIYGPYEDKIVLESGNSAVNGPHQGAMIDSADGSWWFIHFQDAGLYGRIVHLQPVRWVNGWPLIGEDRDGNGVGEPVPEWKLPWSDGAGSITPQSSDDFDGQELGGQWQWQANHRDEWRSLTARKGWLRLWSQPIGDAGLDRAPNLLLQKFPASTFEVETMIEFAPTADGEEAGLVIMGRTHMALAIRRTNGANQIVVCENGTNRVIDIARGNLIKLRVAVEEGGRCRFSFACAGAELKTVPDTFQASAGIWIGAKAGIYCVARNGSAGGYADFDYFRFQPLA